MYGQTQGNMDARKKWKYGFYSDELSFPAEPFPYYDDQTILRLPSCTLITSGVYKKKPLDERATHSRNDGLTKNKWHQNHILNFFPFPRQGRQRETSLSCVRWECHSSVLNPYNESIIPLLSHWHLVTWNWLQNNWQPDCWLQCLRDISLLTVSLVFTLMLLKKNEWKCGKKYDQKNIRCVDVECIRAPAFLGRWHSLEDIHTHTHTLSSAWDDSHAVTSG